MKNIRTIVSILIIFITYITITIAITGQYNLSIFALLWIPIYIMESYYKFKTNDNSNDKIYNLNGIFMYVYNGLYAILIIRMSFLYSSVLHELYYTTIFIFLIPVFILVKYIKLYNKGE